MSVNPADAAVSLDRVRKTYGTDQPVVALDDVSTVFVRGTATAVMGPSGSGKSTLLHCAVGLDRPGSGTVRIGGTDLSSMSEKQLTELRRGRVGFVFQAVADGGTAIDPEVVAQLLTRTRPDARLQRLSPRERDVLALMAEGLGNTAIAERLVVSDGAVHKHIRNIFAKLDLAPTDRTDRRVAAVLHYLEDARRRD